MLRDTYREWRDRTKIVIVKIKIDQPILAEVAPRFRLTFILLWIVAIAGLIYGHLISTGGDHQSLSLLLGAAAAVAAFIFLILKDPKLGLQLFAVQMAALVTILVFAASLFVLYTIFFVVGADSLTSIKIAWAVASLIIAYFTLRLLLTVFGFRSADGRTSLAMIQTAPLLTLLLVINVIWWYWPSLSAFLHNLIS